MMVISRSRPMYHGSKRDGGAVMVEFALVLPWLVVLLLGIFQLGLAFSAQVSVTGAAREGARALALGESAVPEGYTLETYVQAAVESAAGMAKNPSWNRDQDCSGGADYATVTVTGEFPVFPIPFVTALSGDVHATASMRCGL